MQILRRIIQKIIQKIRKILNIEKQKQELICYQKGEWVRFTCNGETIYEGPIKEIPMKLRKRFYAFYREDWD